MSIWLHCVPSPALVHSMPEPFSIITGVVGLTTATINSFLQLKTLIDDIQGAPEVLKNISLDIGVIQPALEQQFVVSDNASADDI